MNSIDFYLNLLTSQYSNKNKILRFLTLWLRPIQNIKTCANSMYQYFNLDTAVGKQLDMIGEILVLPRTVNFQPSNGISPVLDDDHYRLILKAKVAKNQWKGTIKGLQDIWEVLFPNNPVLIVDGQNMTCSVVVIGLNDSLERDLITHDYIVPRPEGVKYIFGYTTNPLYAQDMNTDWLKGFDEGYWLDLNI